MWIAKRSLNKGCCPGELDHIVAGGTPYTISLEDNLYKEAYEEYFSLVNGLKTLF